jgi:predicted membrane protein
MVARAEGGRATTRNAARLLSLATAGIVSLTLLLYPYGLSGIASWRIHAGLPLMMLGVAGFFVYGLGFAARTAAVRLLFHPLVSWAFFIAGALVTCGS